MKIFYSSTYRCPREYVIQQANNTFARIQAYSSLDREWKPLLEDKLEFKIIST